MPTKQELDDLCYNKCDWEWTTQNGVDGCVVRGRGDYAFSSIFLPAAGYGDGNSLCFSGSSGYVWSSVPSSDGYYACYLDFYSPSGHSTYNYIRYGGFPVRPVQSPAE